MTGGGGLTQPILVECAKLRGLRGLEKLRGSWAVGRGTWVEFAWVVGKFTWVVGPFWR